MTEDQIKALNDKWVAKVQNDVFTITKVERVFLQGHHPFTIGPRHVVHASDHCGGMLGEETMKLIPCANCQLPHDDVVHKSEVTAYVTLTRKATQKEVVDQLNPHKEEMVADGIEGFAFPNHKMITDWGQRG